MRRLRGQLTYANAVATLALFIAIGGASAFAASHLGKNTVGSKQLKKNAVTTAKVKKEAITAAKVKKGTLTGTQINVSTLGTVPSANIANTANSLAPPENWHVVGAPGEPQFVGAWTNANQTPRVAFFKDHEGIVHLRGTAVNGTSGLIFILPPGFRPANGTELTFAAVCVGGSFCEPGPVARVAVDGPGIQPSLDGAVLDPEGPTLISLDGITFRAES